MCNSRASCCWDLVLFHDAVPPNRRRAELAILPQRHASGANHTQQSNSNSNPSCPAVPQVKVWTRSHENSLHTQAASIVKTVIDEANLEPGFEIQFQTRNLLQIINNLPVSGREFSMIDSINFKPDENPPQRQSFDEWVQVPAVRAKRDDRCVSSQFCCFVLFCFVAVCFILLWPVPSVCPRRKPHGKEHAPLRNPKGSKGEGSKRTSFRCDFRGHAAFDLQPHSCSFRETAVAAATLRHRSPRATAP